MTREELLSQLPKLVEGYQPSPEVLKRIGNITLMMLVGPSGVGKSTLIEHSGFNFVPSDTTRDPRPYEQEGIDMYFRRDYEGVIADIKSGRFVQIALFTTGDMYATKDTSYPESGVAIMPVMADVIPIFRSLGFKKTITAFVTPPSFTEWMRRLDTNDLTQDQRNRRLREAVISFKFALADDQTHFVLCSDVDSATNQLKDLLNNKIDYKRETKARQIAQSLLNTLK
jgi:guanylate kinase